MNAPKRIRIFLGAFCISFLFLSPQSAFADVKSDLPPIITTLESSLKLDSQTIDNFKVQLVSFNAQLKKAKSKKEIADLKTEINGHMKLYQAVLNKLGTDLQLLLAEANKNHVVLPASYLKSLSKTS